MIRDANPKNTMNLKDTYFYRKTNTLNFKIGFDPKPTFYKKTVFGRGEDRKIFIKGTASPILVFTGTGDFRI